MFVFEFDTVLLKLLVVSLEAFDLITNSIVNSVSSVLLSHRDAISALVPGTVSFGAARELVGTAVGDAAFVAESVGASAQSDAVRAAVGDFKHIAESQPNTQSLEGDGVQRVN